MATLYTKDKSRTHVLGIGRLVEIAVQQRFHGVPEQIHEGTVAVICL
jgi:hypothetical protein